MMALKTPLILSAREASSRRTHCAHPAILLFLHSRTSRNPAAEVRGGEESVVVTPVTLKVCQCHSGRRSPGRVPHRVRAAARSSFIRGLARNAQRRPGPEVRSGASRRPLNPTYQQKNDDDDRHKTKAATRVVSPAAAVGPGRQGTYQKEDQKDDQNCTEHSSTG